MLTPSERQAIIDEVEAGTYDLDGALEEIATEQKGEGVRKAIYGGILLVNKEGKAGAVDPVARQQNRVNKEDLQKQMFALEQTMGNFIANNSGTIHSTLREETTLFSSTSASQGNVSGYPGYFDLTDDVSHYDYVEIVYSAFGLSAIKRFTKSEIQQEVHWTETYPTISTDVDDKGVTSALIRQAHFIGGKIATNRLSFQFVLWGWSGKEASNGVLGNAATAGWGIGIRKVTGINYTEVQSTGKDTELTDLRVGYDGTKYNSAGAALRAQIQALHDAIAAIDMQTVTVDSNGYLRFDGGGE